MKRFNISILFILILSSVISTSFAQDNNLEAAKQHLILRKANLTLSNTDLESMLVSSSYISPTTGWYHVYFNQQFQGIEVYNGILNMALKDGHVINVANNFIPYLENQFTPSSTFSGIGGKAALIKALESLNINPKAANIKQIKSLANSNGEITKYQFEDIGLSNEPLEAKLYWFKHEIEVEGKKITKITKSWNINYITKDNQNVWNVHVDANSGEILATVDQVIKCDFGHRHSSATDKSICESFTNENSIESSDLPVAGNSYNVFPYPIESPNHGSRSIIVSPYSNYVPLGTGPGATNGWHDNGTTTFSDTRGNNVYAQEDTDANNTGGIRPNPSNLEFNYSYTQGLSTASANQNASITNLFFWNNFIHDVLWKLGFDEPSGNFQSNNLGRGGSGNDHVNADAQDGSGTNNANFYTPIDGSNPRMQMFLWNYPTTYQADSDFDNAIIAHEYGHGWSTRLTGGPNNSTCLSNVEQGGEGWSDYLALMLTTNWASLTPTISSANIPRGIGTYVLGQSTSGNGIRPFPYSYNMSAVNPTVTYAAVGNTSFSQPHGIGSIWCTMLWDMTWEIIMQDNALEPNIYNTSNMIGNVAALKLVNEGLRLQPCSPSFVQARDAILAADQAIFGGQYRCAISKAFSRRGLGLNASSGASSDDRIVTADYTPISGNTLSSSLSPSVCSGVPFEYTATTNIGGTAFSWTRPVVSGISNATASGSSGIINETLINTTNTPKEVYYYFSMSPNACGLSGNVQQTIQVTVNPAPITPTVANYSICQNSTMPVGEGLSMPTSISTTTVNSNLPVGPTFIRYPLSSGNYYYKTISYIAPVSASVSFTITSGTFDTYLYLYQTSFNASSPSSNLLGFDDDGGGGILSKITFSVVQGQTYQLVVSSYDPLETGAFTIQASNAGFGTTYNWYNTEVGGTPIITSSLFNPVGVANSGIPNLIIPIVKNYFVSTNDNPNCRTTTSFTISPAAVDPLNSGQVISSDTICAIFNSGTLSLVGHTGSILTWEASSDNFLTYTTTLATNTSYAYAGLVQTLKVRAVIDKGSCMVAKSKSAILNVVSPMQFLSGSVNIDTVLNKTSLNIISEQKISQSSKVEYLAGRKIELKDGFESKTGSVFNAEIYTNACFIPVTLTLQPDATQSKDIDISNLFPDSSYVSAKYLVPFAWTQFGNTEIRRSLFQFDLSSIPTNAVIDSAFLSLSFSQKFVDENPPFTGHFGANSLEIKNISTAWTGTSTTWNNQPATTNTNSFTVPVATSQTQNYPKINVSNLIVDQFLNGNNGFMIKHLTETPYKTTAIASSEESNAALRPKLVIYYRYL